MAKINLFCPQQGESILTCSFQPSLSAGLPDCFCFKKIIIQKVVKELVRTRKLGSPTPRRAAVRQNPILTLLLPGALNLYFLEAKVVLKKLKQLEPAKSSEATSTGSSAVARDLPPGQYRRQVLNHF